MVEAIVWLSRERIAFARVSAHQLKIGPTLSFYPVKGTIMHDGQKPLPQRGLPALQALLRRPAPDATPQAAGDVLDPTSPRPGHNAPSPGSAEHTTHSGPGPEPDPEHAETDQLPPPWDD